MKTIYKYALICFLLTAQDVFSEQLNNSFSGNIDVKNFPDNDIKYFSNNNKAEAWRLVYGKLSKPPYDPNNENDCNVDEENPDEALSFNISEILKNAGANFNPDNIHVYYDGEAGEKALALRLNEAKIKNSFLAIAEVFIRKENSKYTKLTPDRLLKSLTVLNDNEENIMYVCFGYLQHFAAITPSQEPKDDISTINTNPIVDPQKIVFWYDGLKATPILAVNPKPKANTKSSGHK